VNEKIFSCLSDPVKAKLIAEIFEKKQATAGQLLDKYSNIPQATLYRHLKKMTADGILKVVEENPIRGTVEKVYALGFDFNGNIEQIIAENDGKLYMQAVTQYMLGILREFQEYTVRDDMNIALDGSGFSVVPVYATLEELADAGGKIAEILSRLIANQPNEARQLRNLCFITTPPKK